MKAGYCVHCDTLIWRTALDPTTAKPILLWPLPTSRYVRVGDRQGTQVAPGIAVCAACGDEDHVDAVLRDVPWAAKIESIQTAHERYAHWFTPGYGQWLRAHAKDYLKMDEGAIARLLAQWEADRAA